MKKLWHFVELILGIYRWHPTIALRYLPIVDIINKNHLEYKDILEVGSGGLGIAPYIKKRVVGMDVSFSVPIYPQLVLIKGSAMQIPFADNSFAVVVSTDMIEHLGHIDRIIAIYEMLRVSRKLFCIGVPCGKEAQTQDKVLAQIYKSAYRKEFDFFTEHALHGLPEKSELIEMIERSAKKLGKEIYIRSIGTLNLRLRWWLMQGWISDNFMLNVFYRKLLLLFVPLMRKMNQSPTYSQLFIVSIHA